MIYFDIASELQILLLLFRYLQVPSAVLKKQKLRRAAEPQNFDNYILLIIPI